MERENQPQFYPQYQKVLIVPQNPVGHTGPKAHSQTYLPMDPNFQAGVHYPHHPAMLHGGHRRWRKRANRFLIFKVLLALLAGLLLWTAYQNYVMIEELKDQVDQLQDEIKQNNQDSPRLLVESPAVITEFYSQSYSNFEGALEIIPEVEAEREYEVEEEEISAPILTAASKYKLKAVMEETGDLVYSMVQLPDGNLAAADSYDSSVKLFNLSTGEMYDSLPVHDFVESMLLLADGRLLATTFDVNFDIWNFSTGSAVQSSVNYNKEFTFNNLVQLQSGVVAALNMYNDVYFFQPSSFKKAVGGIEGNDPLNQYQAALLGFDAPYGELLAYISIDTNTIDVWNTTDWQLHNTVDLSKSANFTGLIRTVAYAGTTHIVIVTLDNDILIINMFNGKTHLFIQAGDIDNPIQNALVMNKDTLLTGDSNGVVSVWDISTGALAQSIFVGTGTITTLTALNNGEFSTATSGEGTITLFRPY